LIQYEGKVLAVSGDSFRARLYNKTSSGVKMGEFLLEEVSEKDRRLVVPGATFSWSMGYLDSKSGQRVRQSIISFQEGGER
jgi:hypothetical protein